jgi:hypothetical protein
MVWLQNLAARFAREKAGTSPFHKLAQIRSNFPEADHIRVEHLTEVLIDEIFQLMNQTHKFPWKTFAG